MKYLFWAAIAFTLFSIGCSSTVVYSSTPGQKDKQKTKQDYNGWDEMTASFYGEEHHGKLTANGETFDMYAMTCAHKTLDFNTVLILINPDNGNSIEVRVNDRGPFIEGRDIDLSWGAAKKLGMLNDGVKTLKVKIKPNT
jgi:rare lipoprotein A